MKKVDLSIIILNYNTKKYTIEAVESIEKHYPQDTQSGNFEVIVIDNASPDDSLNALNLYAKKTKMKSFRVIENGENFGFAGGNNKGVPYAVGRYVLFLNPDTVMYPRTLHYLVEFMDMHPDAGAVGCKINIPSGGIDDA